MKVGTIYPSASKTFSSSVTDVMSYTLAVLVLVSFVVLETSVLINVYFNAVFPQTSDDKPTLWETQRLFASYDTNGDEVIDLWEFEAVKQRIDEALPTVGTAPFFCQWDFKVFPSIRCIVDMHT